MAWAEMGAKAADWAEAAEAEPAAAMAAEAAAGRESEGKAAAEKEVEGMEDPPEVAVGPRGNRERVLVQTSEPTLPKRHQR
mmetsp:Transcript_22710/g.66942  ORF Transcript_22710/g.66942 Transcript_22710/m.66942 type:complete len:81 (+) Transcript_22710:3-245(+)